MLLDNCHVEEGMKNVLLLGGNGFIGYECTTQLLDSPEPFRLYLANRGRSFDWDKELIKSRVSCVKLDRRKGIEENHEFLKLLETTHFHAVIDFSAFKRSELQPMLHALRGKTSLYIYISSDSVYEVCHKQDPNISSKENDDVRPNEEHLREKYKKEDEYGHNKLRCEEHLRKVCAKYVIDYVTLRLADVIGPRDGTDRWWQYQLWVGGACHTSLPVYVPEQLKNKKLSFVYVSDIAKLVTQILNSDKIELKSIVNQSYNLACDETCTVEELLHCMKGCVSGTATNLVVEYSSKSCVPQMYPSVEKGPIDITKAHQKLKFHPTPLMQAIREICAFYSQAASNEAFLEERRDIFDTLNDDLEDITMYSDEDKERVKDFLLTHLKLSSKPS